MSRHQIVHVVFRYPFERPSNFAAPQVTSAYSQLADQVWQRLTELSPTPTDILAELEQDQVTFDWEQLALELQVTLGSVFQAASELFRRHMGRALRLVDEQEEEEGGEGEGEVAGMRSVESVGRSDTGSPAVELSTRTPEEGSREQETGLRQSLAVAMEGQMGGVGERRVAAAAAASVSEGSAGSSFSDLSDTSLTSSAMQDALLAEAMNGSTLGSILGSRMFPWGRR